MLYFSYLGTERVMGEKQGYSHKVVPLTLFSLSLRKWKMEVEEHIHHLPCLLPLSCQHLCTKHGRTPHCENAAVALCLPLTLVAVWSDFPGSDQALNGKEA